jgi:DNA adenine methylase
MYQRTLFEDDGLTRVVNVASVPQRSPFRFPGGKTWLVPQIRRWLSSKEAKPTKFIEPFAGGGIVGLTVAAEKLAGHVTLVELDGEIAAVWRTILQGDAEWLAEEILNFKLSRERLDKELNKESRSTREKAFQTILKNRTYHGGILAPGSRPIRNGENGKGILSRWYPETLAKRIRNIATIQNRISFKYGDGIQVICEAANDSDAVFFIDPPYTASGKKAGRRLYSCFDIDHEKLFLEVSKISGDFLMTYDDAPGVRKLALRHGFDVALVAMKNTHHAKMSELLIGRNLDWAASRKGLM